MSNGSRTNFCYLSNDAISILKPVDRKIILPRVITLPHFPLLKISNTNVTYYIALNSNNNNTSIYSHAAKASIPIISFL